MKIASIAFERLPGLGGRRCRVEIDASGKIAVSRLGYPDRNGRYLGTLPETEMSNLEEILDQADLLSFKDRYDQAIKTCQGHCRLTVSFPDGGSKEVARDASDSSAPQELIDLENKLESLVELVKLDPGYKCPICSRSLRPVLRYPNYVCPVCADKATDASGRPLAFFNEGFSGGFAARYADTGEPYDGHICYIEGKTCRADEARFGGIVVEVIEEGTQLSFEDFISD